MRILRTATILAGLGLGLAGLAAWQLPGVLDWGPYRARIAGYAASRIGRDVSIGGQIRLGLLPLPVLVARDVHITGRGDGVSAQVQAMRLELSLADLARLRLVPRALVLDRPVVSLPWPLPRPVSPALPRGFSAVLEDGSLTLGALRFQAVSARLQSDPDTGTFAAAGAAVLGGVPWKFSVVMGAPDGVGSASISVTLDGQAVAADTGGTLRGRVTRDGVLTGDVTFRGPDLSRLIPGPAATFAVQGAVSLRDGVLRADDLAVVLANSAGHARAAFHLTPPLRLDGDLQLGQIALGPWLAALAGAGIPFDAHMRLAAAAAAWQGHTLRDVAAEVSLGKDGATITHAGANLPGGTALSLQGKTRAGAGGPELMAAVSAQAADAAALLGWVSPKDAGLLGEAPGRGAVTAALTLTPISASLAGISARLGGTSAAGSFSYGWDGKPGVAADLTLDNLDLPAGALAGPWRMTLGWRPPAAKLRLHLAHGSWRGLKLTNAVFDGESGPAGVIVRQASFDAATGHLQAGGMVGWDGTLTGVHLDVSAADANALLLSLPENWRFLPRIFFGPGHLAVTAAGPANALSGQMRADLNDLRAEGEFHADATTPTASATVTLRHPAAPTLLDELGVPGADRWLDHGSLALSAHLTAAPGHLAASDFSLSAGVARLYGAASADLTGALPALAMQLHADTLTLPLVSLQGAAWPTLSPPAGWQGSAQITAGQVLVDLRPVAQTVAATLTLSGGVLTAAPVAGTAGGGKFTFDAALDAIANPPQVAARGRLTGVALPAVASDLVPFAPFGGRAEVDFDAAGRGFSPLVWLATGSGSVTGKLAGAALPGIDLAKVTELLASRPAKLRPLLSAALASGDTGALDGDFAMTLDRGALTLAPAKLQGAQGSVEIGGMFDLIDGSGEIKYRVMPAAENPPALGVTLAGPWGAMRRIADVAPGMRGGKK